MREDKQHLLSNRNSINVQLACQSQRHCLGLKLDLSMDEGSRGWSFRLKSLAGAWKADLGHRRHATAESIKLKAILHLIYSRFVPAWYSRRASNLVHVLFVLLFESRNCGLAGFGSGIDTILYGTYCIVSTV